MKTKQKDKSTLFAVFNISKSLEKIISRRKRELIKKKLIAFKPRVYAEEQSCLSSFLVAAKRIRILQNSFWLFSEFLLSIQSFYRNNQFHFAVFWSDQCYKFWKKKFSIQFLKNEFFFAFPMFSKKPVTSTHGYFYTWLLLQNDSTYAIIWLDE